MTLADQAFVVDEALMSAPCVAWPSGDTQGVATSGQAVIMVQPAAA